MSYLSIERVAKRYGERTVLHDISLELPPGEFLSLLGPSGCGKTTLLRILAGFERADGGRVLLGDTDITGVPASRRNMGMVFQAYSLFPNMSAADNVRFGLRVRKLAAAEQRRRVAEMLDLVGLADHADKYPHQLSGGQQQRVALARALAIQPTLLLLDEPLSALDAKVRVQLREEIRRIQRETGITTVFVTHDQEEALSISDRVAVMYEGNLVQVGTPLEIYQAPTHRFVARFIGIASVLSGQVADSEGGVVRVKDLRLPTVQARGLARNIPVSLYLRPEHVRVSALNGAGIPPDTLPGTVRERVFLGGTTRLNIALDAGADVFADVPTAQATALDVGSRVHAAWDAEHAIVLADPP
ncbi:ABC transporter ATP-binding protein [Acidihalobacter ferrooxydans]|uniref:Spermidine/putrescine ABC transporter ATP-binding protein n=1 Tax=Acidihalobacter ferrooxydans TaxID=1765967 RepID=A0A1P8UHJ5_9GAMM|nr:ABC transporter ATP-binding protein [Acidihalobacter ferrooxydans]APZ43287.1 spermidine/putrescine ABC transporter ATP-binding protein [Acidihalobacter ferrooxydans]